MNDKQNGFTLVELAISLMVIGLLIGGVLKGQELIKNVRILRVAKDINDIDTAVMIFRSTYNALPGDMRNPGFRLSNCTDSPCADIGNHNYKYDDYSGPYEQYHESKNFWIHLSRAGLIGPVDDDKIFSKISPQNTFGGYFSVHRRSIDLNADIDNAENILYVGDLAEGGNTMACRSIILIDNKIDDGKPHSGRIKIYRIDHSNAHQCYDTSTMEYNRESNTRTFLLTAPPSMN